MYNGPDAVSSDDRPNEESDTGRRYKVSFDGEKMANLVDWEPDGRQTADPEEEETDKVPCDCPRAFRKAVGNIFVCGPDGTDHEGDTFSCDVVGIYTKRSRDLVFVPPIHD